MPLTLKKWDYLLFNVITYALFKHSVHTDRLSMYATLDIMFRLNLICTKFNKKWFVVELADVCLGLSVHMEGI